jgi:hypothetical protein
MQLIRLLTVLVLCCAGSGCGTTKSFTATEQLLVSDAVDTTVAQIDFRPLEGRRAFLDNTFMPKPAAVPNGGLVSSDYVISSLRQQLTAAGVMLCEKREDAEVVIEARLGAMGFDGHQVTYGVPASSSLSSAANTLSGAPMLPALPEISFARKEAKNGAAKLALFAYERETLQPVWQSGIARASSSARDTWLLGIGPLQNGSIYEGTRFAGGRLKAGPMERLVSKDDDQPEALVDYKRSQVFATAPKAKPAEAEEATGGAATGTESAIAADTAAPPPPGATATAAAPAATSTPAVAQATAVAQPAGEAPAPAQGTTVPASAVNFRLSDPTPTEAPSAQPGTLPGTLPAAP